MSAVAAERKPRLPNDLSTGDVKELLKPITNHDVIAELYSFGSTLLIDIKERNSQIEAKAAVVIGWSTGIAAFLFTQIKAEVWGVVVMPAIIASIFAVISAYRVIKTRPDWRDPSDKDWFRESALKDADDLRIFHVRSMHDIRQNQSDIAGEKAEFLLRAERWLIASATLLALGIAARLSVFLYPYFHRFF
ncbi:MAG: plasmid SOS inhibition protein A [Acidobacteriia bacterium]|nr:plasmid SOS inhibition protein A [Terriglobia bacterium]